MATLVAFLLALTLGWILGALIKGAPQAPAQATPSTLSREAKIKAGLWQLAADLLDRVDPPVQQTPESLGQEVRRFVLLFLALLASGFALVAVLYGTTTELSWPALSWIAHPRLIWTAVGLLTGLLAGFQRETVSRRTSDFFDALFGSRGEGSSWVLQAVVGILVLLLVVVARGRPCLTI